MIIPRGTTLLQERALNRIAAHRLSTFVTVDQCAHGAVVRASKAWMPQKRRTIYLVHSSSALVWSNVSNTSPGKQAHPHHGAQLGNFGGWPAEVPSFFAGALASNFIVDMKKQNVGNTAIDDMTESHANSTWHSAATCDWHSTVTKTLGQPPHKKCKIRS